MAHDKKQHEILIETFNELEGLDPTLLELINGRLQKVKEQFEGKIAEFVESQHQLISKIEALNKLSPNAYSLANLTMDEVFQGLSLIEGDPYVIWKSLHNAYGTDYFISIIEREYGKRFAKDYDAIYEETNKI